MSTNKPRGWWLTRKIIGLAKPVDPNEEAERVEKDRQLAEKKRETLDKIDRIARDAQSFRRNLKS